MGGGREGDGDVREKGGREGYGEKEGGREGRRVMGRREEGESWGGEEGGGRVMGWGGGRRDVLRGRKEGGTEWF